jgi:sugar phosphate isomerase/epimerase
LTRPNPLSLHHLTALDVSPAELVSIAGALGCDNVCLFTQVQDATRAMFPCVDSEAAAKAVAQRCADTGVTVHNLEYFPIAPDVSVEIYRPALERGARLGAARATAHIHDPQFDRAIGDFAALCDLADSFDLRIGLEFTAFSQIRSLAQAVAFVEAAGRANADVALDALHYVRSGGAGAGLAGATTRVGYAQLCDGPAAIAEADRFHEAVNERALPGEGAFPLAAFVAALPPGVVIDIEVPQQARMEAGVPALERARLAVAAAGRVLGEAP